MESCNIAFSDLGIDNKMSFNEAKDILNIYKTKFPNVNKLLEDSVTFVKKNKYAWSPLDGRIRYINIDWTSPKEVSHASNIAKNMCAQPVNASVIKKAMQLIRCYINDNKLDAKIVNTIHDELIIESNKKITENITPVIKQLFIDAGKTYLKTVPVDVNVQISNCWVK